MIARLRDAFVVMLVAGSLATSVMLLMAPAHHGHCPFMPGEETACLMDLAQHVAAWQRMSLAHVREAMQLVMVFVVFALPIFALAQRGVVRLAYARDVGPPRAPEALWMARGIMHGKNP